MHNTIVLPVSLQQRYVTVCILTQLFNTWLHVLKVFLESNERVDLQTTAQHQDFYLIKTQDPSVNMVHEAGGNQGTVRGSFQTSGCCLFPTILLFCTSRHRRGSRDRSQGCSRRRGLSIHFTPEYVASYGGQHVRGGLYVATAT